MVNVQFDTIEDYNCCYTVGNCLDSSTATPETFRPWECIIFELKG